MAAAASALLLLVDTCVRQLTLRGWSRGAGAIVEDLRRVCSAGARAIGRAEFARARRERGEGDSRNQARASSLSLLAREANRLSLA